jgi:hypothetical protein
VKVGRQQAEDDQDERERKGLEEHLTGTAQRASSTPLTGEENPDTRQKERSEQNRLTPPESFADARLLCDLEQVVRAEAAEQHPGELGHDGDRVRGTDQDSLSAPLEPTGRIGEENVQEQDRRDGSEGKPYRVGTSRLEPGQFRQEGREPRGDHQQAKGVLGPPPPRYEAADDVREHDPSDDRGLNARLRTDRAFEHDYGREGGSEAAQDSDDRERDAARRVVPGESLRGCRR